VCVGFSKILIVAGNIVVANTLEVSVFGVVFILFFVISVFKIGKGTKESIKWFLGFKLEPDGIK
jgi:hypothetical protein